MIMGVQKVCRGEMGIKYRNFQEEREEILW